VDGQKPITKPWHYDNRELFKRDIEPLKDQIVELCKKYGIPFVAVFQTTYHEGGAMIEWHQNADGCSGEKAPISPHVAALMGVNSAFSSAIRGDSCAIESLRACAQHILFIEACDDWNAEVEAQYQDATTN